MRPNKWHPIAMTILTAAKKGHGAVVDLAGTSVRSAGNSLRGYLHAYGTLHMRMENSTQVRVWLELKKKRRA